MNKFYLKESTAIVVIHGIGEQNPFETLDSFVRGLVDGLEALDIKISASHHIVARNDSSSKGWVESFVRLTPESSDKHIDVHEFYWAYLAAEKITLPEIWEWVEKALQGTKRFYNENEEIAKRYEKYGIRWYKIGKIAWCLRVASLFYPFIKPFSLLKPLFFKYTKLPWVQQQLGKIFKFVKPLIIDYIGDIAIYTTTDEKSKFYNIRQQILTNAQTLVEEILIDQTYKKVIVAGHSLGSVIAFDTLNRLNIKTNIDSALVEDIKKIQGLITFGSPLDKIAFFFREHAGKGQCVRRQVIEQLHSFKAKQLDFSENNFKVDSTIMPHLDGIKWINYYSKKDPISGHLDFYKISDDENIELCISGLWGTAHVKYWEYKPFYYHLIYNLLIS